MPAINQYPQLKADAGAANGGTGQTSYAVGDMLYASGVTALSKLGIGSANTVLTSSGTAPQWSTSLTLAGNLQANGVGGNSFAGVVAFAAGTAAAPSLTRSTDTNTGLFFPAADTIAFAKGGVESMRIDSAGNVGINTSSPQTFLHVNAASGQRAIYTGTSGINQTMLAAYHSTGSYVNINQHFSSLAGSFGWAVKQDTTTTGYLSSTTANVGRSAVEVNNGFVRFLTGATQTSTDGGAVTITEAARIDSAGNLGLGTTNPTPGDVTGTPALTLRGTDARINIGTAASDMANGDIATLSFIAEDPRAVSSVVRNLAMIKAIYAGSNTTLDTNLTFSTAAASSTASERMRITPTGEVYIAGTTDQGAYNLQVNGTGVWGAGAYVNGSDERLKDNITSLESCLDVVASLRPVTFQYKPEHSLDQSVQPGFIAQELQQAMAGKSYLDGVVQAGPEYLNVAYQNLIPILTKAIQEQQALIETLTARVAVLEAN